MLNISYKKNGKLRNNKVVGFRIASYMIINSIQWLFYFTHVCCYRLEAKCIYR